jgi:hypothetical protein
MRYAEIMEQRRAVNFFDPARPAGVCGPPGRGVPRDVGAARKGFPSIGRFF